MPIYILPVSGNQEEIIELTSKAGIHYSNPSSVRDFILEVNEHSHGFFGLTTPMIMVLTRHAEQLLSEMPSVVMSVPNLVYQSDWNIAVSAFHVMDFTEIQSKLAKSGLVAHTPKDLGKRDMGTMDDTITDRTFKEPVKTPVQSLRQYRETEKESSSIGSSHHNATLFDEDENSSSGVLTDADELPGE